MKRVTVRDITHNYPAEKSITRSLWFIGESTDDMYDEYKYEYRSTGAKIISREYARNEDGGDTIIFEISDENAEKYLDYILAGWDNYTIEDVA